MTIETDKTVEGHGGAVGDAKTLTATGEDLPLDDEQAPERVGRYVIVRQLGAGGMGVVLEAYDPSLDRKIALKLLRADRAGAASRSREARARLLREAQAMARLAHPNVITVHEAGADGDRVFVAMELVDGETLGAWLRARPRSRREIVRAFVAAGRGLAAAHAAKLVHRDFKPDNVMVGRDGRVRVGDFGLVASGEARAPGPRGDEGPRSGSLTIDGAVMGTPLYMAPEQHRGDAGAIDERTDQYAFCVALEQALTGRKPFVGATMDELVAAKEAVRLAPGGARVPRWLRRTIARGLAADPRARWPSMDALLDAIEGRLRRTRTIALAAAAIAIAGVSAFGAFAIRGGGDDPCAREAARADAAWGPMPAAAVTRALGETHRAYAAFGASRAVARLDAWAADWRDVRASSCREAHEGRLDAAAWSARAACLDDGLDALGARVAILVAGGDDAVRHADAIATLDSPRECARPAARDPERPRDPRVDAAVRELDRLDARFRTGRYRELDAPAHAVLAQAEAIGWPPLVDRARLLAANLAGRLGRYDEQDALARKVAESAAARGDARDEVRAWERVFASMNETGNTAGIDLAITAARGAAARSGDASQQIGIDVAIANVLLDADRLDEARASCKAADERATRELPPDSESRRRAIACRSDEAAVASDADEVLVQGDRLLAADLRVFGPRHPLVVEALVGIAGARANLHDPYGALVLLWSARVGLADAYGDDSLDVARVDGAISIALADTGDPASRKQAPELGRRALAHATAHLGADNVEILDMQAGVAYVLGEAGDTDGAVAQYAPLEAKLRATRPASVEYANVVGAYAYTLRRADRCPAAVAMLARARAVARDWQPAWTARAAMNDARCRLDGDDAEHAAVARELDAVLVDRDALSPIARGELELLAAFARVEGKGDRGQARALADQARADLIDARPELQDELGQLQAALK